MLMRERDWYREWYQKHVGHGRNEPTLYEREQWAKQQAAARSRRQTSYKALRLVLGWIVLAAFVGSMAHMGYYVSHGLNLEDSWAAMRFDWAYYAGQYVPW